jgi:alkanesulfonate monooxygenase SsuD/methylene tetrahydromethanopterin reductase-like flavin-dependent oxidoreductase (luciferase family)
MLHIGVNFGFGKIDPTVTDEQVYLNETALAVMSEGLGYDSVWATEHHFSDYSFCPDNLLWLAHIAGRTNTIKLGTGAVILPWNDPLRVAEKLLMLDNLSAGRAIFGMGRGLSRTEYVPFNIPLEETRGRFDEAAALIIKGIETGVIEGDGPYYPQPRATLKPGPRSSFKDRLYTVAGSPDSMVSAVLHKARLMSFILKPVDMLIPTFESYRDQFRDAWDEEAPPICLNVNMYCHTDADVAATRMHECVDAFFEANVKHYEMDGQHFATTKGYERYADNAAAIRESGVSKAAHNYAEAALFGTPEQILAKLEWIQGLMGEFELIVVPSFGGMTYEESVASLTLFAEKVAPVARAKYSARLVVGV